MNGSATRGFSLNSEESEVRMEFRGTEIACRHTAIRSMSNQHHALHQIDRILSIHQHSICFPKSPTSSNRKPQHYTFNPYISSLARYPYHVSDGNPTTNPHPRRRHLRPSPRPRPPQIQHPLPHLRTRHPLQSPRPGLPRPYCRLGHRSPPIRSNTSPLLPTRSQLCDQRSRGRRY